MSPPLEKENTDNHEDVSPSVPNTEPAVAATLNETAPSLEDVLPHDELGADAVADITAPSSEGIVGGTSVDQDETVVGEEATQAQPVESSASTTLEETPQQQVVAQEDTGADNETEVAEAAVVDFTEQGETLPETALPEDGVHESHQTSATPEVLEKHEDQGDVTTSQDDQTESVHGQAPNEPSPKESKSDDLVEQIAMPQTAEPEPVPYNNQLELSDTNPAIKPVINEQLTTEDQGIAEVNADSTNELVGNVSVLSGATDESSHSEGEEIGEAVDPVESPVSAAVDEPTPQIPEQEEAVIDEASNQVVASESNPVDGADEIEGTSELQQTEGGDLVAQGSFAEPTIEDDSEAAAPQPHQPPEQDITHDEQHEEPIAVDWEDHTELVNIEEEISSATATDNNEDTLNSPGAPEDVQMQDTLPAEFKDKSQSRIIPDTVDETKPPVEEESAPTHSNIFPEPKHDTTSQLTQDTTTEPATSVPSDEIPQDRIQEVKQDTAVDKETSDDVAAPSATPIAETTSVTEAQQADAPQPSAEPATEGSPQADAEQELPEESDQGVPPIEQPEASGADIAEDLQAESTEIHGPADDAVSVAEPPSVPVVTEHVEAALDAQESSEEVQHIETSTDEKDEDTTYSTVISETLDKVKPAIEEESTPDHSDQADILSGLEHEHMPVEGDSPSSAVGLVGGVEDTLPTPEQNEEAETAASTLGDEVKEETKPEGAEFNEESEVKETELKEETEPPVTSDASAIEEQSVAVHNIVPVPEREELVEFTPVIPEASPAVEEVPQPTIQAPNDADLDEPAINGQVEADNASDVHKASEEQVLQSETIPQLESSEQQDVNSGNDSQAEIIQDAIEPDQSVAPTNQPSEPDVEGQSIQVKDNQEVLPTVAALSEAAEGLASSTQQLNHEEERPETSTDDQAVNGSRSDPNVTEKADTEDVSSLTAAVEEVPDSKSSVDIPVGSDELLDQPTITQAVEEEEAAPNSAEVLAEVPIKGESDVLDQEPRDAVEDKNHDSVYENAGSARVEEPTQTNGDMPAEPVPAPFDASQEPLPGPVESLGIKSEGDAETPTIAAGHPILAEEPVVANDGVEDSSAIDNTAADAATPSLDEVPEASVTVLEKQETKGNTGD
ncbi:hypothetical protein BJ165DRAFT_689717 [Panaeolus papilionaceus]|nr:hypothetical protein BJ165DRAFT_689717 [Panaeolus papilionaceus]